MRVWPNARGRLPAETVAAKEARNQQSCRGKLLDCFFRGILGITVWPKWQSSPVYGDIPAPGIKGNRSYRRRGVNGGETQLDLSRKVYSICHHHLL